MEDIMLMEYLRKKGILSNEEYKELIMSKDSMSELSSSESMNPQTRSEIYSEFFGNFKEVTKDMDKNEKDKFINELKNYNEVLPEHFNEAYSKFLVSKMWHKDSIGRKYAGEKYNMDKAKEICERYRGMIPSYVTLPDIYLAVNYQYHMYHCLFKKWFGEDIDHQVIESAITYWFKDCSAGESKLWNSFKMK